MINILVLVVNIIIMIQSKTILIYLKQNVKFVEMNMNASFVNYVWEHFLCKLFWVDENPCNPDIPLSFFCDNRIGKFKRGVAAWTNKCLFAVVPIVTR